jgi:hypothetical protein
MWSPVALFVLEDDRVVDRSCSETFNVGSGEATVIGGGSPDRVMIKYKKLANLGFHCFRPRQYIARKIQKLLSTLRQKPLSFLTTRWLPPQERTVILLVRRTNLRLCRLYAYPPLVPGVYQIDHALACRCPRSQTLTRACNGEKLS